MFRLPVIVPPLKFNLRASAVSTSVLEYVFAVSALKDKPVTTFYQAGTLSASNLSWFKIPYDVITEL